MSPRARREIHHHEGSCLSLALDKWAQMKPASAQYVCVRCVHACMCFVCTVACVGHGNTGSLFRKTHIPAQSLLRMLYNSGRATLLPLLLLFFVTSPLQDKEGARNGSHEEKETRGGGIVFLPLCIMDEACGRCSICGSLMALRWPAGVTQDSVFVSL